MLTETQAVNTSPWHAGELRMQQSIGVAGRMDAVGRRNVRSYLTDQHRAFFPQLPFVVAGAVDARGDAWATLLTGRPGFMQSPDEHALSIGAVRDAADPADAGLNDGQSVGLLGIELHTRRRNRMNGVIRRGAPDRFTVEVEQSYGNCPQYIQLRAFEFTRDPATPAAAPAQHSTQLSARARDMIAAADTLFVASYVDRDDGHRQVDVSHRGGRRGFVRVSPDGVLSVPDFAGNLFFNTLGNFLVNPKAGMVFVDFESGDLLQLSGDAEVVLDSPEIAAFQGAERLWRFTPRRVVYRPGALALRWAFQPEGWSPNSLMTGDWTEAADRLRAAELGQAWRRFRIAKIVDESPQIRSFHLQPLDDAGIIAHEAGQFLPIRLTPDGEEPLLRTYTLSVAPSDGFYRISVKREGRASGYLHGLRVGDTIEARAPAGKFGIDALERRPAVLLAAGVGVTPMLAMLRHIVYEGKRKRRVRPSWFFQASHDKAERPFGAELEALAAKADGAVHIVRALSDTAGARDGVDYEHAGRIDLALLSRTLPFDDYDFYLCGPAGFMQALYDGLRDRNIADSRIHAEAFGPAGLTRRPERGAPAATVLETAVALESVPVVFMKSAKEARWEPDGGSLLELAEARGLTPAFGCRAGTCGTCATRIMEGAVAYPVAPSYPVADGEALICCSMPAEGVERLSLEV